MDILKKVLLSQLQISGNAKREEFYMDDDTYQTTPFNLLVNYHDACESVDQLPSTFED